MAICNALGTDRRAVRDALYHGRCGLGPSPIPLPFETVVGAVRGDLPELPDALLPWSTRTARIASVLLGDLTSELEAMRRRWRPDRIAVLLGTSTAGADVTENA